MMSRKRRADHPPDVARFEQVDQPRQGDTQGVSTLDRRRGSITQVMKGPRVTQDVQGSPGECLDICEAGEQPRLTVDDHFADRLGAGGEHHASAGERVHERPRKHKGDGQVDVQVAEAQQVDQGVGRHQTGEDKLTHVVIVLREHMLFERAMTDVLLVAAVADAVAADDDEQDIGVLAVNQSRRRMKMSNPRIDSNPRLT